ncbi:MAG: hypothetical protein KF708_12915 [Pirellulales bacterium]|nr:hypothetical protein [Pirellulales bacterium]
MRHRIKFVATTIALLVASQAQAQQSRVYQEGDVTYHETRHVVQRPVTETTIEARPRTVYRERYTTDLLDSHRVSWTPVTEYRWESNWRGRFNPFVQPWMETRLVPRTYWSPHTEIVKTPVTRRELVPETVTDQVPVVTRRFVAEEHISRVPISPTTTASTPTTVARANQIGGVANLSSDRPIRSADSEWRPSVAPSVRY